MVSRRLIRLLTLAVLITASVNKRDRSRNTTDDKCAYVFNSNKVKNMMSGMSGVN